MAQVSNVPSSDVELTCSSETKAPVSKPVIVTVVEGCQTESSKPIDCKELLQTTASQSEVDLASERAPKVPENSTDKSGSEGNNPFIREKVVVDGYNWRKYGQKLVKGNEFVRSYYRCTHPNCKAKKQLERSPGEHIVETVYFGEHDHPKPLASPVLINQDKRSDVLRATSKENSSGSSVQTHSQTEPPKIHAGLHVSVIPPADDVKTDVSESSRIKGDNTPKYYHSPAFKRRKKEVNFEQTPMERSTNESRTVVQTQTLFDVVNDGYRWRKYGQKSVKASPYPRSYYRCSSSGCPVKKHVERSTHDAKLLITTYEGKHDHDIPPGRVVTPNNLQNSEVDDKELSPKEGDDKKTPLSSALQSIKKDQHVEDRSRIKPETNGLEKRHDHGLVLDEKLKETTKDRSDVNKDHTANHAKSDDKTTASEIKSDAKTTASQEKGVRTLESQEQKLMPETSQS